MPCCIMSVRVIRPEHATIDDEVQNFNNPKSRSFTAQEISANFAGLQIVSSKHDLRTAQQRSAQKEAGFAVVTPEFRMLGSGID